MCLCRTNSILKLTNKHLNIVSRLPPLFFHFNNVILNKEKKIQYNYINLNIKNQIEILEFVSIVYYLLSKHFVINISKINGSKLVLICALIMMFYMRLHFMKSASNT